MSCMQCDELNPQPTGQFQPNALFDKRKQGDPENVRVVRHKKVTFADVTCSWPSIRLEAQIIKDFEALRL